MQWRTNGANNTGPKGAGNAEKAEDAHVQEEQKSTFLTKGVI